MMARVEGMPLSALRSLDWTWDSFGDWLGRLDGAIGVNAGFLVGHSTLRRVVMGDEAVGGRPLRRRWTPWWPWPGGASKRVPSACPPQAHTHNDGAGQPVPSRSASRSELEALAASLADTPAPPSS